jgi:glycolate oxidase FAD binding subunit
VRDFILGVRFVDGGGRLVRTGGKVVKNAAGFDISKLMVGSLGQLGVLVEMTFKVFPGPEEYATLRLDCARLEAVLEALTRLYTSPLDLEALDVEPAASGGTLWVRLGGLTAALRVRLDRVRDLLGGGEVIDGPDERMIWQKARELAWVPAAWSLVKVPLTPRRIPALEQIFADRSSLRRYSSGGHVCWLASPESPETLDAALSAGGFSGLILYGPPGRPRLGPRAGEIFAQRVKEALDPDNRFVEV